MHDYLLRRFTKEYIPHMFCDAFRETLTALPLDTQSFRCDGSLNEKRKSPLCISSRESVCIPSSRRSEQSQFCTDKEVRTDRELVWKSTPSLTTAFSVFHWCTARIWFIRTVEVTIQLPTTARMLRAQSQRDPKLL